MTLVLNHQYKIELAQTYSPTIKCTIDICYINNFFSLLVLDFSSSFSFMSLFPIRYPYVYFVFPLHIFSPILHSYILSSRTLDALAFSHHRSGVVAFRMISCGLAFWRYLLRGCFFFWRYGVGVMALALWTFRSSGVPAFCFLSFVLFHFRILVCLEAFWCSGVLEFYFSGSWSVLRRSGVVAFRSFWNFTSLLLGFRACFWRSGVPEFLIFGFSSGLGAFGIAFGVWSSGVLLFLLLGLAFRRSGVLLPVWLGIFSLLLAFGVLAFLCTAFCTAFCTLFCFWVLVCPLAFWRSGVFGILLLFWAWVFRSAFGVWSSGVPACCFLCSILLLGFGLFIGVPEFWRSGILEFWLAAFCLLFCFWVLVCLSAFWCSEFCFSSASRFGVVSGVWRSGVLACLGCVPTSSGRSCYMQAPEGDSGFMV